MQLIDELFCLGLDPSRKREDERWLLFPFLMVCLVLWFVFLVVPLVASGFTEQLKQLPVFIRFILAAIIPHVLMLSCVILAISFAKGTDKGFLDRADFRPTPLYIFVMLPGIELLLLPSIAVLTLAFRSILDHLGISYTNPPMQEIMMQCDVPALIMVFVGAVILAPIGEELMFRRVIYGFLRGKITSFGALLVTSFLFMLLHHTLVASPAYMLLGVVFQLVYIQSRSLIPSILLHALHNGVSLTVLVLIKYLAPHLVQ